MKIYLIRGLYNLQMKESNSITTHLNAHKRIIPKLSLQAMNINDELHALLPKNNMPRSSETFDMYIWNSFEEISHRPHIQVLYF